MKSPVRFALFLVAGIVTLTVALGVLFVKNPIGISQWVARASLERMELEKSTVTIDRGAQVYYHGGEGRRTLVLLHDMGHQASSWVNVVPGLLTRYRLIILDLAGHGESEPREGVITLEDSVRGLDAVLNQASPDAPVMLLGNAMGAWVSMLYTLEHPDRVERLVLVNGGGLSGQAQDQEGPLTLLPESREEAARLVKALSPEGRPAPAGFVLDDLIEKIRSGPGPRQIAGFNTDLQLDQRLGELQVGVDILWGRDDQLLPLAYGRRLHEGLTRSRFHELTDCGHIPHQQCTGRFLEALFAALELGPPAAAPREEPAAEPVASEAATSDAAAAN